jgi:hypothetical protein
VVFVGGPLVNGHAHRVTSIGEKAAEATIGAPMAGAGDVDGRTDTGMAGVVELVTVNKSTAAISSVTSTKPAMASGRVTACTMGAGL